jgi:RNase P subunit RPR2
VHLAATSVSQLPRPFTTRHFRKKKIHATVTLLDSKSRIIRPRIKFKLTPKRVLCPFCICGGCAVRMVFEFKRVDNVNVSCLLCLFIVIFTLAPGAVFYIIFVKCAGTDVGNIK